jgi:hypothetical protein
MAPTTSFQSLPYIGFKTTLSKEIHAAASAINNQL